MTFSGPNTLAEKLGTPEGISIQEPGPNSGTIERKILFFAIASDLAQTRCCTLFLDETLTLGQLRDRLISLFPLLRPHLHHCALALDGVIARDSDSLGFATTIAILPPVSGG